MTSVNVTPDELYNLKEYFRFHSWEMPTDKKTALWNVLDAKMEVENLLDKLLECSVDERDTYTDDLVSYMFTIIVNRYYIYYNFDEHYNDKSVDNLITMIVSHDAINSNEEAIEVLMDSMHNLYTYIREMQMLKDNISSCINSAVTNSDDITGEHKLNDIIKRITQFKSHGVCWSSDTFGSYYENIINTCMHIACLICAIHLDNDKIITEEE